MKFINIQSHIIPPSPPDNAVFPYVVLGTDNWNDFGYTTLFPLVMFLDEHQEPFQSYVKILQRDPYDPSKDFFRTTLPSSFTSLGNSYCSIGPSLEHYIKLMAYGPDIYKPLLVALRDITYSAVIAAEFEDLYGFHTSLLRFSEAMKAYKEAPALFTKKSVTKNYRFTFKCSVPGAEAPHEVEMDFSPHRSGLNRTLVLIGRNGTGKTRFLAEFAQAMSGRVISHNSYFKPERPSFSRVIAVSYSVFDDFDRPSEDEHTFSYKYCGLRSPEKTPELIESSSHTTDDNDIRFLTSKELREKLLSAQREIYSDQSKVKIWGDIVRILLDNNEISEDDLWKNNQFFDNLSSGQKILVAVVTQIISFIRPDSIILFDEPELHLHPEVFAALARALHELLDKFESFSIIATHSPLLLQETLGRQVRIFKRVGTIPLVSRLNIESFGESLSNIISEVFSVDSSDNNFRSVLDRMLENNSAEDINSIFDDSLPLLAQSYLYAATKQDQHE